MTEAPRTRVAIYDLDRTITSLPTWTPFLLFAAWRLARWRLVLIPLVGLAALGRLVGRYDRDALKVIMHRRLLGPALDPRRLDPIAECFAERIVRDHLHPGARWQLAADRDEGARIVIATAAHHFYAAAIARRLGVADLVATEASRDVSGHLRPEIAGANCYGTAKRDMIARWLAGQGIDRAAAHLRFYSDHISDAPTFDWVNEAVVINPGPRLAALAQERGWRRADWRQRR